MDHRYRKFFGDCGDRQFSAAARQLRVSQPAMTLAVASLERALGAKLYVRHRHAVSLTPEGEIVAQAARATAQAMETMRLRLNSNVPPPHYQVGIIDSIAHLLYTSAAEQQPLNSSEVMVDNSRRIINNLLAEKIDVGVITGQPAPLGDAIAVHKLRDESFVFVCAPEHAREQTVTHITDWLAVNQDSTTYQHFVKLFRRLDIIVQPIFYSTSMELLKDMALAGKGTALLPRHLVQAEIADGSLRVVATKPLARPIWAIMRTNGQSKILQRLAAQVDRLLVASLA